MSQVTERCCPSCGKPGLVFSDDPNQEGWGSTGEWNCPNCEYWATDHMLEIDELYEGDDEDWDDDEEYDDDEEF